MTKTQGSSFFSFPALWTVILSTFQNLDTPQDMRLQVKGYRLWGRGFYTLPATSQRLAKSPRQAWIGRILLVLHSGLKAESVEDFFNTGVACVFLRSLWSGRPHGGREVWGLGRKRTSLSHQSGTDHCKNLCRLHTLM